MQSTESFINNKQGKLTVKVAEKMMDKKGSMFPEVNSKIEIIIIS